MELIRQNISIKYLSEKLDISQYHTGQKLKDLRFYPHQINIILDILQVKYEDIFK